MANGHMALEMEIQALDHGPAYKNDDIYILELGTIIFKADSLQQMIDITSHMDKYYKVEVKQ